MTSTGALHSSTCPIPRTRTSPLLASSATRARSTWYVCAPVQCFVLTTEMDGFQADVYDHMDYILTSLDMFSSIAENLIDYTFNIASYEMNEVMYVLRSFLLPELRYSLVSRRRLTLVTMICLPLTLLTGYFVSYCGYSTVFNAQRFQGMNFDPFPAVNNNSDQLFWIIALPVMAVLFPIFLYSDIVRMVHYISKRWLAHKTLKDA